MKNLSVIGILVVIALFNVGCSGGYKLVEGNKNSGKSGLEELTGTPYQPQFNIECNEFRHTSFRLAGQLSVMYDRNRINNQLIFVDGEIRLRFDQVPTQIVSSADYYLQVQGFSTSASGAKRYEDATMGIVIEVGGVPLNRGEPLSELSKEGLETIIDDYQLNTSVDYLLRNAVFILLGANDRVDAVTLAVHRNSNDAIINSVDALIPYFSRDYSQYASTHSTELNRLHPSAPSSIAHATYDSNECARF